MNEDEAFLAAIRSKPADDNIRLIYADWLDERNDPRGEILRIECQLHRMPKAAPDSREIRQRLGELGGQVDVRWFASVCRVHVEIGDPHQHPARCPLNASGPFYTCWSCLACEAPESEAPDLLASLKGNSTTYFVRQPETAEEVKRACSALSVCCVMDLRYGGTDPKIIAMLGNNPEYCDNLLAADSPRLVPAPPEWREQGRVLVWDRRK